MHVYKISLKILKEHQRFLKFLKSSVVGNRRARSLGVLESWSSKLNSTLNSILLYLITKNEYLRLSCLQKLNLWTELSINLLKSWELLGNFARICATERLFYWNTSYIVSNRQVVMTAYPSCRPQNFTKILYDVTKYSK